MAAVEAVRVPVSLGTRLRSIFRVVPTSWGVHSTSRVGTLIVVEEPISPPVIKAPAGLNGNTLVNRHNSKNGPPETSFMILKKNVVWTPTAVETARETWCG
jgi:hypothetical protein